MKKAYITILILLMSFYDDNSYSFVVRNKGDMFLGIIGSFSFPQIQLMEDSSAHSLDASSGKEYDFGIEYGYFVTNSLSLSIEANIQYKKVTYIFNKGLDTEAKIPFDSHFVSLNIQAQYYWFEFFYLGGGFFMDIPFGKASFSQDFTKPVQVSGGFLVETGVNMRVTNPFSIRIAFRSVLPVSPMLKVSTNKYRSYSFPMGFHLGLEWVF